MNHVVAHAVEAPSPAVGTVGRSGWSVAAAPALAAALFALIVYACTLRGTFIYDDVWVAQTDPRVAHPSLWGQYWTKPYMGLAPDKLYRPLNSLSFAVQRVWTGERAWPFHLVNWLLHAAVAAAVAELGRRLAGVRVAWVAGLLFAAHPVHVEAVAGLVGRAELLCALATLLGLCAFLGKPLSARRIVSIALCCAVAMFSKEQGMLFAPLILALVPLRRSRPELAAAPVRQAGLWLTVTLCYMLAGYLLLRESLIGFGWDRRLLMWVMNPMIRSHGIDRILMPVVLAGRYTVLLVAPHRQSIDYGAHAIGWTVSASDPYLYLGFFAILLWFALLVLSVRYRNWAALFCLLGFALTYGMTGNIVALIGTIFAERLMYAPSIFFIVLVAMGLARLPRQVATPVLVALTLTAGVAAFDDARLWNAPEALFAQCVRNQPGSERAYDLLYDFYSTRGNWQRARQVAHESLGAIPDSDRSYEMCIWADLQTGGSVADAWRLYNRGLTLCTEFDRLYLVEFSSRIPPLKAAATQPARPSTGPADLRDPSR